MRKKDKTWGELSEEEQNKFINQARENSIIRKMNIPNRHHFQMLDRLNEANEGEEPKSLDDLKKLYIQSLNAQEQTLDDIKELLTPETLKAFDVKKTYIGNNSGAPTFEKIKKLITKYPNLVHPTILLPKKNFHDIQTSYLNEYKQTPPGETYIKNAIREVYPNHPKVKKSGK